MEILLHREIKKAVDNLFNTDVAEDLIQIQETNRNFKGDFTLVVFPLLKVSRQSPEKTCESIGTYLFEKFSEVAGFNVVKGFLNIEIERRWWIEYLQKSFKKGVFSGNFSVEKQDTILIEYSSPNTNKPLHLGHIRNNLLGFSLYRILSSSGHKVIKTNIVNDRGIHICKSMVAWKKFGKGETPETTGIKGDHLVGKYYVRFEKEYKVQTEELISNGVSDDDAKQSAPLMKEAREMLLKWESGDKDVVDLWHMMNQWVYDGFDKTYKELGVDFDKIYYESETYKLGRDIVFSALKNNVLYKKEDSSIWADLTGEGLDNKLLLRSDGTAVYMTQDLGTAVNRFDEYKFDKTIYVVGNEQDYHFQVLKVILKKIGYQWADGLIHFSYGMVELPEGKMKSREGKVVDADDLIQEMYETARNVSMELGKLSDFSENEMHDLFSKIGMGALKYYILKVDPKKNMTFNPEESIDFNGNTGPFIQYTYARIKSILRKATDMELHYGDSDITSVMVNDKEIGLIKLLRKFSSTISEAATNLSPALIANYCYELAKEYNQFYHDYTILGESDNFTREFRLILSKAVSDVISKGMWMLGIEVPERM